MSWGKFAEGWEPPQPVGGLFRKGETMKGTGIFVTKEELERVRTAQSCSGMFLSGGMPLGNPQQIVYELSKKYNAPAGSGLNLKTGEFCLP